MASIIDRKSIDFLVFDVFGLESILGRDYYADLDRESISAVLDLTEQIANNDLWSHREESDRDEPWLENGQVYIIPEAKEALEVLKSAGFFSAHASHDLGGMQLPVTVNHACLGMFKGANVGTASYMGLTRAAANLLNANGSEDLKRRYMVPLLEGRYFGTMCLSEPEVGSSLIDTRTRAIRQEDGTYIISGSKMWISGGDQDASENIVHLVLAKTPDAPHGVKGLSLFAVPKYRINEDGSVGNSNGVTPAGLNHKMGYRGTSNCLLNFSESADNPAKGELVGEEGAGLAGMFHMMNESRISVGIGGAMLANVAYRIAVDYAKERRQGRSLNSSDRNGNPVPIIDHPDVRRMLMRQKVFSEGAMALCLYAGMLSDRELLAKSSEQRQHSSKLLEVVTPVVKAWSTEFGLESNKLAIQVLGGYGYTRDFPVEQLYRDNRLNMIHEGTNGIQALDLLGRKMLMEDGTARRAFLDEIRQDIGNASKDAELELHVKDLLGVVELVEAAVNKVENEIGRHGRAYGLSNATPFMNGFGHMVVGWLWIKQASSAIKLQDTGQSGYDSEFLLGKINACRFFFEYELPDAKTWLGFPAANPESFLDVPDKGF